MSRDMGLTHEIMSDAATLPFDHTLHYRLISQKRSPVYRVRTAASSKIRSKLQNRCFQIPEFGCLTPERSIRSIVEPEPAEPILPHNT
jgi:hypothetical protein